jgi:hypothetical protein
MGNTPISARCSSCKSKSLVKTGKRKSNTVRRRSLYRCRKVRPVEVICARCGHIGWTTHPSLTESSDA